MFFSLVADNEARLETKAEDGTRRDDASTEKMTAIFLRFLYLRPLKNGPSKFWLKLFISGTW